MTLAARKPNFGPFPPGMLCPGAVPLPGQTTAAFFLLCAYENRPLLMVLTAPRPGSMTFHTGGDPSWSGVSARSDQRWLFALYQ